MKPVCYFEDVNPNVILITIYSIVGCYPPLEKALSQLSKLELVLRGREANYSPCT